MRSISEPRLPKEKKEQILCAFSRPRGYSLDVDRLVISLAELPEEGKSFAGELAPEIFDLPDHDARPLGPLLFQLRAQRFDTELLLMGSLQAPFEFQCARTLISFKQTISVENAAISLEIKASGQMDATEALREELLLHFPAYPRCDEGDDPLPCEIDDQYLAVDNRGKADVENPPAPQGDRRWSALDDLPQSETES